MTSPVPPRDQARRLFQAAIAAHRDNRLGEAVELYARVLRLTPRLPDALGNMGAALRSLGLHDAAAACQSRAIALAPDRPSLHSNLGNALRDVDRLDDSLAAHRRAVELDPDSPGNWYNMGLVLQDLGRLEEAVDCFDRTLAADPDNAKCRWDRSLALMLIGDLEAGFAAYESRWELPDTPPHGLPPERHWDGAPFPGKTLLLHQEQGFGDAIQFVRYAPMAKALGGDVTLRVHPSLIRLFESVGGVDRMVSRDGDPGPFDLHAPLLSVPRLLGTTLDSVPADVPYLAPPPRASFDLPRVPEGDLGVGISWGGSPTHRNDRRRSAPLDAFLRLAENPSVHLHSLQKGERAAELRARGGAALCRDLDSRLGDFADTAAAIGALDLVISVDASVAHLAGALGREAWVLLPFAPDWRWLRDRDDSPWYPGLRLFRQATPGDWAGVFERVREALTERTAAGTAR